MGNSSVGKAAKDQAAGRIFPFYPRRCGFFIYRIFIGMKERFLKTY
jgi:hypothetical protein